MWRKTANRKIASYSYPGGDVGSVPGIVFLGTEASGVSRYCAPIFSNYELSSEAVFFGTNSTSAIPTSAGYSQVGTYFVLDGVGLNVGYVTPNQEGSAAGAISYLAQPVSAGTHSLSACWSGRGINVPWLTQIAVAIIQ